jgi:hypothetical protein
MIAANDKIIISVDFDQKENIILGGSDFLLAKQYSKNRRESMPVLCRVENGNRHINEGTILLVHHNRFSENSPHYLGGNLYSLAYNSSVFARVDSEGNVHGLCDNIIVEYVYDNESPLIPQHLKKPHPHKYKVVNNGYGFKAGQYVFAYEKADYEIVYVFNGQEKRVIKLAKNDIVGKIVNN